MLFAPLRRVAPRPGNLQPAALAIWFGLNLSAIGGRHRSTQAGGKALLTRAKSATRTDRAKGGAKSARRKPACSGLKEPNCPQRWVEPAMSGAAAAAVARRLRKCASSASSAQNSEQKCRPAELRQNST